MIGIAVDTFDELKLFKFSKANVSHILYVTTHDGRLSVIQPSVLMLLMLSTADVVPGLPPSLE